jgi:hypothetical protein
MMADPAQIMATRITEGSPCSMLEHLVTLATSCTGILHRVCSHLDWVQVRPRQGPSEITRGSSGVNLPALGFRTRPPIPLPIPLMRPAAPSFSAPRSGCVISPEMPS